MRRLFTSDLHLEDPQAQSFQRFAELMAAATAHVDEVYLLGDITELWIGDDDDSAIALALKHTLARTAARIPVFLMQGNRDFLYGEQLAQETGVQLLPDPSTIDELLLAHGDAYCTDDTEYQAVRSLLRSAQWQQDILARSLQERRALGRSMREQSERTNANKAANIMDVNSDAVSQAMTQASASTLIHGHTHRPGFADHGQQQQRWTLGAWDQVAWYLLQEDALFSLRCWPLAVRYESETLNQAFQSGLAPA